MKRMIVVFSLLLVLVSSTVTPVFAQRDLLKDKVRNGTGSGSAIAQEKRDTRATNLKERADKELSRRIESLQKLINRINEFKKITASQKATLVAQVQTEINNLTALQAKIRANTDPQTLQTDVQSIVKSYRTYGLYIPKIQILGAADRMINIADQLSSQAAKLQIKLSEAQAQGKDVAALQTLLTDMQAKIVEAKQEAQNAINAVTPLTPEGYPGNKTKLEEARRMLNKGHLALIAAQQNAKRILGAIGRFRLKTELKPTRVITPKLPTSTSSAQ